MTRSSTWAVCTWSAPAGTTPSGSTTSCAAAPAGRATRARRRSSPAGRTSWWCRTSIRQAAHRDRRGRPDRQPEGRVPARPRAAGRRGPAARRARQHVAVQPARSRSSARIIVERRNTLLSDLDRPRRAPGALAGPLRRAGRTGWPAVRGTARADLPADHAVPPRPRAGPITRPTCPISARASTCGRWVGRTRSTSSTGLQSTRSAHWPSNAIEAAQQTFETADLVEGARTSPAWICPSWPVRPRRGRTWCTTTRCRTTRCRR